MYQHFFSGLRYYSLVISIWLGVFALETNAQTLWQMVHEEDVAKAEKRAESKIQVQIKDAEKSALVPVIAKMNTAKPLASHSIERGWRENITATIFWIGEKACSANPVHNKSSSWDMTWVKTFGGVDHPSRRSGFHPKSFQPKANPFYVALPYNDIAPKTNKHKTEASKLIWWYNQEYQSKYLSVCKGKWVAIKYGGKTCYAQWEDCGPFLTNDANYVFKGERPKTKKNGSAGIDLSPAIRDYLKLKSGAKVSWKFVEQADIERGPWSKWSKDRAFLTKNP